MRHQLRNKLTLEHIRYGNFLNGPPELSENKPLEWVAAPLPEAQDADFYDNTIINEPPWLVSTPKPLEDVKAKYLIQIDADTDAIYAAAIGNRGPEYTEAESAANAYKDAGYTGDVPSAVQSWATAKNWTAQQAADDILAAAAQLNTAKLAIRAERLLCKEQVRAAADAGAVKDVMTQWAGFVTVIRGQLGL